MSDVWEYVEQMRNKVRDLESRVQKAKDNDTEIQNIMAYWSKHPLYERKEEKNTNYLYLGDRTERCRKRYNEITRAGENIHKLVDVSNY